MTTVTTLIIYDVSGMIISTMPFDDTTAKPTGVPYLIVEVPAGMIVDKVDVTTGTPVYRKDTIIASELDKMNAKMDYIAMMSDIDLSGVTDLSVPLAVVINEDTHSQHYNKVLNYCLADLWTLGAVKNAIGKWITNSEYSAIVKAKNMQES